MFTFNKLGLFISCQISNTNIISVKRFIKWLAPGYPLYFEENVPEDDIQVIQIDTNLYRVICEGMNINIKAYIHEGKFIESILDI